MRTIKKIAKWNSITMKWICSILMSLGSVVEKSYLLQVPSLGYARTLSTIFFVYISRNSILTKALSALSGIESMQQFVWYYRI